MNPFGVVLEAKQDEVLAGLTNREEIVIMPAAQEMDQVQHAAERDITVPKLNLDYTLLRAVRAILKPETRTISESPTIWALGLHYAVSEEC